RPAAPRPASAVVGSSQPPRSIKGLAIAGVVGGALAAGVLLYLAPWKWTRPAPVSEAAKSPAPPSAAPSVAESVAAKPTPPPVAASPAPNPEPVKEPRSESPARPAVDPAQVKRDRADYERMKSQATEARGRAASAGASAHDLSGGDLLRDQAASFAGRGRFSDALKPISDATTAYALAFSTAQARAATSTRFAPAQPATEALAEPPPARVPTSPAPVAAAPAASAETATRPSPQPSPGPSAATTQPAQPIDERPAVEQVVRDYARALAAGDVGGVLQVYPGLPSDVQKTLRDYFKEGWTLDTGHWRLSDIVVTGSTATVKIGGTTIVRDKRGKSSEQDPPNAATLERGPNGWKITALNGAK
ncbi:MAG TPA: hypothetical protein VEG33_06190, partial [Streptosporangiaceae bacterium]|nr:hypothetical protein [Streptosporangiaceae bacterium]